MRFSSPFVTMKKFYFFFSFLFIFTALWGIPQDSRAADMPPLGPFVEARLLSEFNTITPGETLSIALHQRISEGWHIYWKNPGDSGEPTSITWDLPKGFTSGEILWPAPHQIPLGPLVNFGYEGEVTLLTSILVPETIEGDKVTLTSHIEWLACKDICVPEFVDLSLTLPVSSANVPPIQTAPDLFVEARSKLPTPTNWQGLLEEQDQTLTLTFHPDPEERAILAQAKKITFFPEEWGIVQNAAPQQVSLTEDKLILSLQRDTRSLSSLSTLQGVLTVQNEENQSSPLFSYKVELPITLPPMTPTGENQEATGLSLGKALFFALLGGLILNLMPCVFPILSMKALSLIRMSAKEQKHAVLHAGFYTAGIMTCFAGIAAILIALQTAGEKIGWGFQLQSPIVVLLLAYLLFLMGLNLSGFFEFKGHFFSNLGHKLTEKHGYAGTFFTGMLATVVATPCTAPFMGAAMGFALTQPEPIALAVFMALGFGLALPYILLCILPPLRRVLPKPGAWMETFRQFLAFPLYASVAWLVWVYNQQTPGSYGVLLAQGGLILITLAIWVGHQIPHKKAWRPLVRGLAILLFLLALFIAAMSSAVMPPQASLEESAQAHAGNHTPFTTAALEEALSGDNPIFINMTAAWCLTCKVNERVALATDSTQTLLKDHHVTYLLGDWTNRNPEITDFLEKYGRSGVPLYVYYGPRDPQSRKRPDPVVLPQLLTPGLIEDALSKK